MFSSISVSLFSLESLRLTRLADSFVSSRQNAFGFTTSRPDSSIAEPDTTAVQFPASNSQQRAKPAIPSFEISDPDQPVKTDDDDDEEDNDERPELPTISIDSAPPSLAPPTTTVKVLKAPKGRVRVEKGFSQLDWAKLNRSGEVDLRVSDDLTALSRLR